MLETGSVRPAALRCGRCGLLRASPWQGLRWALGLFALLIGISLVTVHPAMGRAAPGWAAGGFLTETFLVLGFAFLKRRELKPLLGTLHVDRGMVLTLLVAGVAFVAVMLAYFDILRRLGVPTSNATVLYAEAGWAPSVLVLTNLIPAVVEELAFRGVIQTSLQPLVGPEEAWLIQAVLFSVLHLSPIMFPYQFMMGLCFGYLRLHSRSLYPAMVLRVSWSAYLGWQSIQAMAH